MKRNILFVSLYDFNNINCRAIYPDLIRKLIAEGHNVTIISPVEKRNKTDNVPRTINGDGYRICKPVIGNIQKTAYIEKGVSTLTLPYQLKKYYKRYLESESYDLIIYTTPPPTLSTLISYIKKKKKTITYLLLKDIWPQGLVDDHAIEKKGITALIYYFYRWHEIKLYKLSDFIGCMSKANVEYILKHNSYLNPRTVSVNPNSIEPCDHSIITEALKKEVKTKFNVPCDRKILFYGGNLGIDQAVSHLIACIKQCGRELPYHFVICGSGTHYSLLEDFVKSEHPENLTLLQWLDKSSYDTLLSASDAGLIFLNYELTTPNFPSRLLTYMEFGKPVLACTDTTSDIGQVIMDGDFGEWCTSDDPRKFVTAAKKLLESNIGERGENARQYLLSNYTVNNSYAAIKEALAPNENSVHKC